MAKDVASGPKAVNIVRPQHHQRPPPQPPSPSAYSNTSSYFSAQRKPRVAPAAQIDISRTPSTNYSYSTSTVSSTSTNATNLSSTSNARVPPTIYNSATASNASFTLFQPSSVISYSQHQPMLVHRHSAVFTPQRSRSNSVHSKPGTVASEPETESESDENDDLDDPTQLDDDDQSTASESEDDESEEEEDESDTDIVAKVVAKIKNGTIMNGKGEFVNKTVQEPENEWREEAKINRKIADLEISNTSLLAINATLEGKLRKQAKMIEELKRQLSSSHDSLRSGTPTPDLTRLDDSDEQEGEDPLEGDEVFTRIRSLLENLLENAQQALDHKSKATGRVLSYYDNGNVEFCTAIQCDDSFL
ncbi:hypothetical protein K450DRAFT_219565 [Umbelopsis ramanniana AG]|uniref:Uncharacterized protein n=1 Tax=Umbelopsis ramanniana AG TaxID=1314678 RepID=A0AAD5EIX1_UMBRA|nr:uncharacterized protein K450DRAFT_219565 [Umbelopsis ramanniana AG]KAI8584379.1 hypothetical protein K450DRAFT_219565 [Umbelopsis ramanniana AG]